MPYVIIEYSAVGKHEIRELSDESANAGMEQGRDFVFVDEAVLAAWRRHCEERTTWNTLWRALGDELALKLREPELKRQLDFYKNEAVQLRVQLKERSPR